MLILYYIQSVEVYNPTSISASLEARREIQGGPYHTAIRGDSNSSLNSLNTDLSTRPPCLSVQSCVNVPRILLGHIFLEIKYGCYVCKVHAAPLIGSIITMIFANLPWVSLLHHLLNYTLWETRGKLPANEQNSIYNTAKISKTIDEAFWKTLYGAGLILQKDIDKFCHLIWPMKWCVTKPPFSNQ